MEALATIKKLSGKRKISKNLICEILDGQPLYYKGYRDVLLGKKQLEDIMGASAFQMVLINYFVKLLLLNTDEDRYWVFGGETGLHINMNNNLSSDVTVFEKSVLTNEKITLKYADVPPKIVIEVDTTIEFDSINFTDYLLTKTQRLLDFGTERIIWILTKSKKVYVAEAGKDWYFTDWNNDVFIFNKISFNIGKYIEKVGLSV